MEELYERQELRSALRVLDLTHPLQAVDAFIPHKQPGRDSIPCFFQHSCHAHGIKKGALPPPTYPD